MYASRIVRGTGTFGYQLDFHNENLSSTDIASPSLLINNVPFVVPLPDALKNNEHVDLIINEIPTGRTIFSRNFMLGIHPQAYSYHAQITAKLILIAQTYCTDYSETNTVTSLEYDI